MNHLIFKYSYEISHDDYMYDNNSYTPIKLLDDVPENQQRFENQKRNGDEFEAKDPEEELDRIIKERKDRRQKRKQKINVIEPHPFYTSQYGYQGLDGTFSIPMADYSGSILDGPGDMITNPYSTPYQSASARRERMSKRAFYLIMNN